MNKRRKIWIIGIGLAVLLILGIVITQKQSNGYQSHKTISTGQLRRTTFALVSSAENSTTDYQKQYRYIEDIQDGRGYTTGIIGFTSANGDLRQVVLEYQKLRPNNRLVQYLPALKKVEGTASHKGLGEGFVKAWHQVANDKRFIQAQDIILNQQYMRPVLKAAKADNLGPLGQYIYYDAIVVHGPGNDASSFGGIRKKAKKLAGSKIHNQTEYLKIFLKIRSKVMKQEKAHQDLSRINTQKKFIREQNFQLKRPLKWKMYGDKYELK
ncbi:chitosanase [Companilactobacillus huachuanensis]|uniref:Chitosanase n=1 Tax=Companilactobacillus huachuanensis TaxID=2559914 RepID=A0ABW1RQD4_9LACO|nr:chitosanase [Companilactobacillus huachuanensis]